MSFQAHALEVLEFARLLDHVAGHASSTPGAARIRALRPLRVGGTHLDRADALDALRQEHVRVAAMRALITGEGGWRSEAVPELTEPLVRLRVPGTSWTGRELRSAIVLLQSSRRTKSALEDDAKHPAARAPLARYADALVARPELEQRLERVLNEEGEIKDDASPALRRIRRELRGAEGELVRLLERLMSKLEDHHRVDDASVTLRNGRYVIPVRREGRAALGGIVHDSSHSGQTVFVEPPAAVEAGNRIRELESEEITECERILLELTESLRPERDALMAALEALIALDALYGRARYALAAKCIDAELGAARDGFSVVEGRHPLLLAQGIAVVPFTLAMAPEERTLLVSGPNTGGKTVLLKALALCSLMVQSGIPAPVGPESTLPCFDDVFADIGDEQSLEASLSTFSAHLKHLTAILDGASADALVLVDELGSGTDPLEGAALGGAILEELTRRGTTTIATTHLGALKELASEVPGVVNASLQFDAERLAPTYRLIKGIPGRSYGLAIAQRLRMPAAVLKRAEERVPAMERDLSALLADVERRAAALGTREKEVTEQRDDLEFHTARLAERERVLKEKEREYEREQRRDTRRYLLEARKEVERTIKELKTAGAASIDATAAEARRKLETRAAGEQEALEKLEAADRVAAIAAARTRGDADEAATADARGVALAVGDAVAVGTLGGKIGKLIESRGNDAVVAVGAMKLTVPFDTLRRMSSRHLKEDRVEVAIIDVPDVEVKTEVDVRGMRVHEVDEAVTQALDAAVRADIKSLRIIHGKGTGALRERVNQLLRREKRVKDFRLGAWNEGGAGVTVAEFSLIPDEVVEQIAQQADIVAIISEHVRLKKTGSVWRGPCPFHQGTNANFSVMPRGGYTCFVCGEKGSVFTFVQKRLGMSFAEAVKYVGEKCGIEVKETERKRDGPDPREPMWELQATVGEYFTRVLWDAPGGQAARDYLASRDVSRTVAERFGIGFAPREVGAMRNHLNGLGYDDARLLAAGLLVKREEQEEPRPRFRDRLMFPIHDASSHLVGFGGRLLGPGEPKYLNSADSEIFNKGKILYNLHSARNPIRRDERVILVEGYFDALRLVAAGIECVVAPMGTALTESQAELLGRYSRHVFLLYDSDAPGQKATFRAADVLLAKGLEVRVVTLPDGEDPDTFVRKSGREAVEKLLEGALDVFDRKVQLLERAGWFNDLQHKRRALDRLLPTIRAATDPVTRDLYIARASQAAGVAREVLLAELHTVRRGTSVRPAARPAPRSSASGTPSAARGDHGPPDDYGPPDEFGGHGLPMPDLLPTGPYKSEVEQGNAEQTLLRVLLTQPMWQDQIIEDLGKIEAEEMPGGEGETDALGEESPGVLRDPIYRAIYDAVLQHGADGAPEAFADSLSPYAVRVYEDLRGEKDAVVDAKKSIADGIRMLRARSADARIRSLESLLRIASEEEKDRINVAIKRLTDEKRALGIQSWGSMRGRR